MSTVLISLISEQAMPNVMAPLLAQPRPDTIKCILPTDLHNPSEPDSRFVAVFLGIQNTLQELGFKVRDRGPVPPYNYQAVKDMCAYIRQEHPGATFIYNITGGTKLMAQAALDDARAAKENGLPAWALYVDTENSRLVTLVGEDITVAPFDSARLQEIDVEPYLQAYSITTKAGIAEPPPDPWLTAARTMATMDGGPGLMQFLVKFSEPRLEDQITVTWDMPDLPSLQRHALEVLVTVTNGVGAQMHGDRLTWPVTPESKDFIWRRHWLEWYTFDCVMQVAREDSAWQPPLRNVKIMWPGWERLLAYDNELDVAATRNGRLYICECKAGENAPSAEHIYKLQVVGFKAGTFANKILVTATTNLTKPGGRQREDQVIRALALDILLVGADNLPDLTKYLQDFDYWLYEQQTWFTLRSRK